VLSIFNNKIFINWNSFSFESSLIWTVMSFNCNRPSMLKHSFKTMMATTRFEAGYRDNANQKDNIPFF
jgi:hypothetical protein